MIELLIACLDFGSEVVLAPALVSLAAWLREVVLWGRANRELLPVREMLAKSMKQIDSMRCTERVFGIKFLD